MTRRLDTTVPAAAAMVVLAAVLGGGFPPKHRMLIGLALIVVWVVAAIEWRGGLAPSEFVLAGLIIWGAISAAWVGAAPLASKETTIAWVVAWALWIVARRGGPLGLEMGSRVLVLGTAAIAGAVLVTAIMMGSVRTGGSFENPNVAVAFLVPALPMGMMVFRERSRLRWGWLALVSMAVVLTGSRAGLLAAIVAVAFLLPRGRIRFLGVLTGAGLAAGALAWRFISQPDLLAWHRVSIWQAVFRIWTTRPLTGIGPGCLVEAAGPERILHPDQVGRYQFVISFAESTPLAVLVQLGLVGIVLAVFAAGLWWVWARRSGVLDSKEVRAGLAAIVVLSLFHDFLTVEPVLWWWAVVLGCLEGQNRPADETGTVGPPTGVRLAGGFVVIWLTLWGILSPALARWIFAAAPNTSARVERILRIEPWYPEPATMRVRDLLAQPDRWSWETAAEGLHWAKFATAIQPGLARRWADLGRVHIRILTDLGGTEYDADEANGAFVRASELDPHLPWNWLERARLERILGFHHEAVGFARRAVDEEPNTVRGWLMLGRLAVEQGRMTEARRALAKAKESANLMGRPGLTDYERELLMAPVDQIESLERALNGHWAGKSQ